MSGTTWPGDIAPVTRGPGSPSSGRASLVAGDRPAPGIGRPKFHLRRFSPSDHSRARWGDRVHPSLPGAWPERETAGVAGRGGAHFAPPGRRRRPQPRTCAGAPRGAPGLGRALIRRGNKGSGAGGTRSAAAAGAGRGEAAGGGSVPLRHRGRCLRPKLAAPNAGQQRPLPGDIGAAASGRWHRPLKGQDLLRWNGRRAAAALPRRSRARAVRVPPGGVSAADLFLKRRRWCLRLRPRPSLSRKGIAGFAVHVSEVQSVPTGVIFHAPAPDHAAVS